MSRRRGGDAAIVAVASRQYGVVTRRQALAALPESAVALRIGSGDWQIVLPSVYRVGPARSAWRQHVMAACLWAGPTGAASHATAAALWGLGDWQPDGVDISSPRRLRAAGVRVHPAEALPDGDRATRHGIPVTDPTRTLLDLAGAVTLDRLDAALADAVQRRLTSRARFAWRLQLDDPPARRARRRLGISPAYSSSVPCSYSA